jgi:hypothetical protein
MCSTAPAAGDWRGWRPPPPPEPPQPAGMFSLARAFSGVATSRPMSRDISMYARGMSTREIAGHLLDLYGVEVSADLISTVSDAELDEIATWQARPLEPVCPLVFFDALRVRIRDEGLVRNKAVHIALGVRADGTKDVLGLWLEQNEGAKFWLRVMNALRNRAVEDGHLPRISNTRCSRSTWPRVCSRWSVKAALAIFGSAFSTRLSAK